MSSASAIADGPSRPVVAPPPAQTRRALFALGVGGFGIGTGEFVIMGLLPDAARDLAITIPQAGHLISIYALGVVIGAPLLAILGARWPRRSLLVGLMLVFALGNLASAIAPGFGSMALARLLTGFPHGTYFGVAALVAAGLVPRERRTQAVAMVLLGLTLATLLGVPVVAAIGQWFGWRCAFAIVGAIGALTALLVWLWVPFVPGNAQASPLRELGALRRRQVILT
ncbi:MFS transporter, partial [Burkholderia gladioli]|nr:MFS transporter [Burkholderia gladioli]